MMDLCHVLKIRAMPTTLDAKKCHALIFGLDDCLIWTAQSARDKARHTIYLRFSYHIVRYWKNSSMLLDQSSHKNKFKLDYQWASFCSHSSKKRWLSRKAHHRLNCPHKVHETGHFIAIINSGHFVPKMPVSTTVMDDIRNTLGSDLTKTEHMKQKLWGFY